MLYHIPNEGKRSRVTGARLVAEGLKRGVPDICLPVARGGCHGLYIELKRERSGRATPEQTEWMNALMRQGYAVSLCHGWERAARVIEEYLEGGGTCDNASILGKKQATGGTKNETVQWI